MSNLIDSLLVSIGLDASEFTAGSRKVDEALDKTGKSAKRAGEGIKAGQGGADKALKGTEQQAARTAKTLEAKGGQGAEFFERMTKAALPLIGILTAGKGLMDFARSTMDTAAATGRLAHNLDMSTSMLSAWTKATEQFAGGTAADAGSSIGALSNDLKTFALTGQSSALPVLSLLHVGLRNTNGTIKSTSQLLTDLSKSFAGMDPQKAQILGSRLGLTPAFINLLEQGPDKVRAQLGIVGTEGTITGKQAAAMQRLQTAMIGLETASSALGRTLLTDVTPGIVWFTDKLTRLFELMGGAPQTTKEKALGKAMTPEGWANTPEGRFVQNLTGVSTKTQQQNRSAAMAYFQSQGWSKNQAAAITAQIQSESSYNPAARNGDAVGIAQWLPARQKAILAGTGIDVRKASYADQLRAIQWELTHTEKAAGDKLRATSNPRAGAIMLDNDYERSGDGFFAQQRRATRAQKIAGIGLSPHVTSVLSQLRAAQAVHHSVVHHETHHHHNSSETHIGPVSINTKASDPRGVASAVKGLAVQANSGLS